MPLLLLPVPWRCPSGVRYIIAKCQCLNKANFEKVALKCQKWHLTFKKWTCGKYADISYWTSKQSPQSKNIWMKCIIHKKPNTVVTDKKMKIKNIMVPRLAMMLERVYEQMSQAWVWAHHISTLVRLLPDHRVL